MRRIVQRPLGHNMTEVVTPLIRSSAEIVVGVLFTWDNAGAPACLTLLADFVCTSACIVIHAVAEDNGVAAGGFCHNRILMYISKAATPHLQYTTE